MASSRASPEANPSDKSCWGGGGILTSGLQTFLVGVMVPCCAWGNEWVALVVVTHMPALEPLELCWPLLHRAQARCPQQL